MRGDKDGFAAAVSERTQRALVEAATAVFADQGYAAGSVRAITRLAGANQAAITYHFGGKEGLYRAVLQAAIADFERENRLEADALARLPAEEALRAVIRQFFVSFAQPDRLGRYMRIFGRESLDPTAIYMDVMTREKPRLIGLVEHVVRRFLPPDADEREVALTSFWLLQQPVAVVRNAERLRRPPFDLAFDPPGVAALTDLITRLAARGLAGQRG